MTPEFWKAIREAAKGWYILENGKVRPAKDVLEAGEHLSDMQTRRVDETFVGDVRVSTVFLGLDQNYFRRKEGPPILFETLIEGGKHSDRIWRYAALAQAKKAHWEIVDALRNDEEPFPSVGEEVWVWRMLAEMFGVDDEEFL